MILLRVTLIFILLLILPDWYIYKKFIASRNVRNVWMKRLYWLPSILLFLALIVFLCGAYQSFMPFGIYLVTMLSITCPKAVFTLFHLILHSVFRLKKPATLISLALSIATFCYILFGAIVGKHYYHVKEVAFYSKDLPEVFDGYRILQISDIHSGSWNNNVAEMKRAIELCNAQQADVAFFTGDLVNSLEEEVTIFDEVLSSLKAKDGVYAVLGNHDYGTYAKWRNKAEQIANIEKLIRHERRLGWDILINEHRVIRRGKDSLVIVGVENSGKPPFPNRGNLPKALAGTSQESFKVLLSHDPTHWRRKVLPETNIQLMLAGHTHDKQMSLFGFSPAVFIYPEHRGLYEKDDRGLYVNIGLGYVLFPMRIGAWPEITVITLKKQR